nr:hypothetical protein [Tanacetum cinerariifolium]
MLPQLLNDDKIRQGDLDEMMEMRIKVLENVNEDEPYFFTEIVDNDLRALAMITKHFISECGKGIIGSQRRKLWWQRLKRWFHGGERRWLVGQMLDYIKRRSWWWWIGGSWRMAQKKSEQGEWIFDSGCTEYITHLSNALTNNKDTPFENHVIIPNGDSIPVKGKGDCILLGGKKINGVLYIPDFKCNLLSFWNTAVVKRSDDVTRLQALVDKKKIVISEEVVREILQLDDAEGIICLPNDEIFAGLARMGYEKPSTKLTFYKAFFSSQWKFLIHTFLHSLSAKRTSWNEFISAMASALICLSTGLGKGSQELRHHFLSLCLKLELLMQMKKYRFLLARVKKLERLNKVKSSKLGRLKKVGTSQRVESSEDVENVFNQGRISVDINEGVELEVDQEKGAQVEGRQADTQAEIFNIDLDHTSKVLSMQEDTKVQEVVEVVNVAKLITEVVTVAATTAVSAPVPAAKPKVLKIAVAAPATREEMEKEDGEIIKSINETPAQKAAKRRRLNEQAKEDEALRNQLEVVVDEDDDVFIEATPIGTKVPVVNYEIVMIKKQTKTMFEKRDGQDVIWRSQQTEYGQALVKNTKVQEVVEVANAAKLITEVVTAAATAAVSAPVPAAKTKVLKIDVAPAVSTRKRKGVVIRDPEEELHKDTPVETPSVKDKGKRILIEDPKPMKKKDQIAMDAEYAKKLQEELEKEHDEAYK